MSLTEAEEPMRDEDKTETEGSKRGTEEGRQETEERKKWNLSLSLSKCQTDVLKTHC